PRLPADRDPLGTLPPRRRAAGGGRRRARQRHLRGGHSADRAAAAGPRREHPPGSDRPQVMEGAPVLEVVDSPLDVDEAIRASQPLPEALPILPLRETVTYPETLTPLAVGQER